MIETTCHCGAVSIAIPSKPRQLTSCNCSICRRYGALWAYYKADDVRVRSARGATTSYSWDDKSLKSVRCGTCGCVSHWEPVQLQADSRVGVNTKNFEPCALGEVRVRHLDGASTWKFLD
jgi:hypothetical protein